MARIRDSSEMTSFFDDFSKISVGLKPSAENIPHAYSVPSEQYHKISPPKAEKSAYDILLSNQKIGREDGSDLYGWSEAAIDRRVEVRYIEGRGRCLFTRVDLSPGEIVFIENPTFVAIKDFHPELFRQFEIIHKRKGLELPPVWHFAALCVLTMLPRHAMDVCLNKWVPDYARTQIHDDTRRVFRELPGAYTRAVNMQDYEIILQAWRFNSFGHHSEENGLVLYDRTSMMSHSCHATCCWHFGYGDSFVLRCRTNLKAGDELTISYLGDEELLKSTDIRREKLAGWLFNCSCERCVAVSDPCRAFRCQTCGVGSWIFKQITMDDKKHFNFDDLNEMKQRGKVYQTDVGVDAYDFCVAGCSTCGSIPNSEESDFMLSLEKQYADRLSSCSASDPEDLLAVWSEAEKVFVRHWITAELIKMLKEHHCSVSDGHSSDYLMAIEMNHRKLDFIEQGVSFRASYERAWTLEEHADLILQSCGLSSSANEALGDVNGVASAAKRLGLFRRQKCVRLYEDAYNVMAILVGCDHEYAIRAKEKWQRVLSLGSL
eukprot:GDKJ01043021.1.p1 GENE.GDKJ01043021.1~~GDKJ01043021.1.p1  ORF type:complete len:546 (-),score=82.72 GDKJ01043021.1:260-1897(-)